MSGQSHGELLRLQKVEPFRSHAKSLCVRLTCTIKLIYQVKWINTSEKTTRNSLQHRIKSLNNWLVFVSMRGGLILYQTSCLLEKPEISELLPHPLEKGKHIHCDLRVGNTLWSRDQLLPFQRPNTLPPGFHFATLLFTPDAMA